MTTQIADSLLVEGTLTATGNISGGGNVTGNQTFTGNVTIAGSLYESAGNNIIAAGTVQGNATALTAQINIIGNVASGTGVSLPLAIAGSSVTIYNGNATTVQVYSSASGTDTLNGITGNLGVALYGGAVATAVATAAGAWTISADSANQVNYVANATNANMTFSAANITGGSQMVVFQNTATTGNLVATLPTAAATVLAIQCPSNFSSYTLRFVNSSATAGNWSIANATGWSLFGNMIIPTLAWRDFQLTVTSASGNTTTLRNIGLGTFVT